MINAEAEVNSACEVSAAGFCDSAQLWVLLLPSVRTQIYRGYQMSSPPHVIPFPHAFNPPFLSSIPANLFPDFHMKEAVGVNAAASNCSVLFCLLVMKEVKYQQIISYSGISQLKKYLILCKHTISIVCMSISLNT